MSCPCREPRSSSRAELSLLSPGWTEHPQLQRAGWSLGEGCRWEAAQAVRQGEGKAATLPGSEAFITTKQRYRHHLQGQEGGGFAPRGASDKEVQRTGGSPFLPRWSLGEQGAPLSPQASPGLGSLGSYLPKGVLSPHHCSCSRSWLQPPTLPGEAIAFSTTIAFPPEKGDCTEHTGVLRYSVIA